jgi:23S rRNA (cytosine1962-C5)-methyltransferase
MKYTKEHAGLQSVFRRLDIPSLSWYFIYYMTIEQHKKIVLKKNEERRILRGHQWIFSNEIQSVAGEPASGESVDILRCDGKRLGSGFYNPHSLIAVRVLSYDVETVDFSFFEKRIRSAHALRSKLFPESSTYRLVHGESDFLPGLIIDRYNDYFSIQTLSAGMDRMLTLICDVLDSLFSPKGIVERNESALRNLEQLPLKSGILRGTVEPTVIELNGVKFSVDILSGQKTGFFLDQRMNRAMIQPFAKSMRVLDCFSNEGGFALYAAAAGAKSVTGVDSSEHAIAKCKSNAELNGFSGTEFVCSDVFKLLDETIAGNTRYDLVIVDPPAFAKNKKTIMTALKGYRELNTKAMMVLEPSGILATASCSHHVTEEAFIEMIDDSARKAGRKVRILSFQGASPDHPVLPSMPETKYLKFAIVSCEA